MGQDNIGLKSIGDFMKRTVFLVAALFALMAVGLYAQTEADFEVDSDGKTISIYGYKGSATAVVIPARIKNLPVGLIDLNAFQNKDKITSVTIPNGITKIESGAFENCTNLTSVIIPASVIQIRSRAFNNCSSLTSVTFGGTIPSSGTSGIHDMAFQGLGDLRDKYLAASGGAGMYTRPNGTTTTWTKNAAAAAGTAGLVFALTADSKGYSVSRGTVNLRDVVIPASYNNLPVTTIPNSAFNGGSLIQNVTIPESVTTIQTAAFANCSSLNSITFGRANTNFSATDFPNGGDLANKYKAGGAGTYTRSGTTWTKK